MSARTVGFQPRMTRDDKFHDRVIAFPAVGKGAHRLFASFFTCFALSSGIRFKICFREDERCKNYPMDKVFLKLAIFEEFATAVLQTVATRFWSLRDHFFGIRGRKQRCVQRLAKKPF